MILRRGCPVCGLQNIDNKQIFARDFSGIASLIPFRSYQVFGCVNCGMIYAGELEETMPINEYYRTLSKYENDHAVVSDYDDFSHIAAKFFRDSGIADDSRILDIGCGAGFLLNELSKLGYKNIFGLELSKKNCEHVQATYGIHVFYGCECQ